MSRTFKDSTQRAEDPIKKAKDRVRVHVREAKRRPPFDELLRMERYR